MSPIGESRAWLVFFLVGVLPSVAVIALGLSREWRYLAAPLPALDWERYCRVASKEKGCFGLWRPADFLCSAGYDFGGRSTAVTNKNVSRVGGRYEMPHAIFSSNPRKTTRSFFTINGYTRDQAAAVRKSKYTV